MKTRRIRQRGSGFFNRLFSRKNKPVTINTSRTSPVLLPPVAPPPPPAAAPSPVAPPPPAAPSTPEVKTIINTHAHMVNAESGHAQKATEARSAINAAQTVGQTLGLGTSAFAGIAAGMALAGKGALLGAAAGFPPLLAALMGTYLACLFVARQRNINRELMANLYIIKMEIDRMKRVYAVIEKIAEERKFDLNTVALRGIVDGLGKKIMIFAGKDTKQAIQNVEKFLRAGDIKQAAEVVQGAENALNSAVVGQPQPMTGGFLSYIKDGTFASWKARWLSPGETLRIIIRDVTIANIWFSIMIAEYNVFKDYMDLSTVNKTNAWVNSDEMKELITANKQLRDMTHAKLHDHQKDITTYSTFYSLINDPATFEKAFSVTVSAFNQRERTMAQLEAGSRRGSNSSNQSQEEDPL